MLHIVHLVNRRIAGRPVHGAGLLFAVSAAALVAGALLLALR